MASCRNGGYSIFGLASERHRAPMGKAPTHRFAPSLSFAIENVVAPRERTAGRDRPGNTTSMAAYAVWGERSDAKRNANRTVRQPLVGRVLRAERYPVDIAYHVWARARPPKSNRRPERRQQRGEFTTGGRPNQPIACRPSGYVERTPSAGAEREPGRNNAQRTPLSPVSGNIAPPTALSQLEPTRHEPAHACRQTKNARGGPQRRPKTSRIRCVTSNRGAPKR